MKTLSKKLSTADLQDILKNPQAFEEIKFKLNTGELEIEDEDQDDIREELINEVLLLAKEMFSPIPGPEGPQGPSGKTGKQGPQGRPGITPKPGIDYLSKEQVETILSNRIEYFIEKIKKLEELQKKAVTLKQVESVISKNIKKQLDFSVISEKVARGLEKLKGNKMLSFWALKDVPPFEKSENANKGKGLIRGGGEKTYHYDLSGQCDGSLKTFNIPSNKRVLGVYGTDFPFNYRPVIDWSGSGSTTLTLTSEVPAPSTGATLYILYVP